MAISSLLDVTSSGSEWPWSERSLSEPAKIKKGKTLKQKVSIEFKSMLQFSFAYLGFDYSIFYQQKINTHRVLNRIKSELHSKKVQWKSLLHRFHL